MADIEFEKILNKTTPKHDPTCRLIVEPTYWGHSTHRYRVTIPKEYPANLEQADLITRCDNTTYDLLSDPGQASHFGGRVEWVTSHIAEVTVWVD